MGSHHRVLLIEDDYLQTAMSRELQALGVEVLGPVGSVTSALGWMAANEAVDGAILDINLRGEWSYPIASVLQDRAVPFVFWTGYDQLQLQLQLPPPPPHDAAGRVLKRATAQELVAALFDPQRSRARRVVAASLYLAPDGDHLLVLGAHPPAAQDAQLTWIGSTLPDRAVWSRMLRLELREGVFYRVPGRYLTALKVQLEIIG